MSHAVTMPALSDTMSNGRLVKWTKKPGDAVKKGEVIAEIETDKAVMDVEAFDDGYLSGPLVPEGTEAPVGQVIGYIADSKDEAAASSAAAVDAKPSSAGASPAVAAAAAQPALPVSAVLAASLGGGHAVAPRSRRADPAPAPTPTLPPLESGPPYRVERASALREAVARNMIACAATPTFRVTAHLPVDPLVKLAKKQKQSLSLLLARACARSVVAHPLFNAAYTPNGLAYRDRVDIGIAVDRGEGLITPVLRDVAGKSLAQLSADWNALRDKVTSLRLQPSDYAGATFYLSDLGVFPVVDSFDSIVPPGAAAILSVAAARTLGTAFTLACDHRVVFGADAARFLETLAHQLAEPQKLLDQEQKA